LKKVIKRNQYLNRLIVEKDNELVKVITGTRRSGKTYILNMFREHLKNTGILKEQIIYLNFESFANEELTDLANLYQYIAKKIINKKMYLLFDEIQQVKNWQRVVNSFRVDFDSDIYITGSNASLLSGELATLIAGRYTEIKVYPLSFKEYLKFKDIDEKNVPEVYLAYQDYFKYGGMPTTVFLDKEEMKFDFLSSTYDSILLKDVSSRQDGAKNTDTLQKIALFLMDSIGSEISVNKLENRMKSNKIAIGRVTINNYLRLMEEAFIFYNVPRFDVKGAKQLTTNGKYYIADIGLWNSQMRQVSQDMGHKLENFVFLELLRRKYTIQVGAFDEKEIDFIATKNGQKEYYQVAYELPKNSARETDNFLQMSDNYRKILITNSLPENTDVNGVEVINIVEWLLGDEKT